jgi:hypothetical protein
VFSANNIFTNKFLEVKKIVIVFCILTFSRYSASCQSLLSWPDVKLENKPFTRWWWLGNAVDTTGIDYKKLVLAVWRLRLSMV